MIPPSKKRCLLVELVELVGDGDGDGGASAPRRSDHCRNRDSLGPQSQQARLQRGLHLRDTTV